MSEPKEIKNKLKFNNQEYKFSTDTEITEGSSSFITSGAISDWVRSYSSLAGIGVADEIAEGNPNLPTSNVVANEIADVARFNKTSGHVSTPLRQNVISGTISERITGDSAASLVGKTYIYNTNQLVFYPDKYTYVQAAMQPYILYYNVSTNKFFYYTSGTTIITL